MGGVALCAVPVCHGQANMAALEVGGSILIAPQQQLQVLSQCGDDWGRRVTGQQVQLALQQAASSAGQQLVSAFLTNKHCSFWMRLKLDAQTQAFASQQAAPYDTALLE